MPSVSTVKEASSPMSSSSITTLSPASPNVLSTKIGCNRLRCLFEGTSGDNALSCSESICLDENRCIVIFDISHRCFGIRKRLVLCCWDPVFTISCLAKSLLASKYAARLSGPNALRPRSLNTSTIPSAKGASGTDNG